MAVCENQTSSEDYKTKGAKVDVLEWMNGRQQKCNGKHPVIKTGAFIKFNRRNFPVEEIFVKMFLLVVEIERWNFL